MTLEEILENGTIEIAQTPTEGMLFEVNPLMIDRSIFEEEREDLYQDGVRRAIQKAFKALEENPDRYANCFYTMFPEKTWDGPKTMGEINEYAVELGGQLADWVEHYLEIAQRIFNGEDWETLCNNKDTAKFHRVITHGDGDFILVGGGSVKGLKKSPAQFGWHRRFYLNESLSFTVPLVVFRKKQHCKSTKNKEFSKERQKVKKLEIVFSDGRKEILDCVESVTITEHYIYEETQIPNEGKMFEVNPLQIDRSLFAKPKKGWEEWTRNIILEAFAEIDKNPERYSASFYTLIPAKTWIGFKTVTELEAYAKDAGDHMADWVEQALEWAQRISNGESWEVICDKPDTACWKRLVIWKNNHCRLVGDSRYSTTSYPATDLGNGCASDTRLYHTVPLVVIKKE